MAKRKQNDDTPEPQRPDRMTADADEAAAWVRAVETALKKAGAGKKQPDPDDDTVRDDGD
jgi:hypothetical protein